jgi:hypothetical protein
LGCSKKAGAPAISLTLNQRVAGSNPVAPTHQNKDLQKVGQALRISGQHLGQQNTKFAVTGIRAPLWACLFPLELTIRIPAGGLRIGPSGNTLLFRVHFDVCPTWIELVLRHLEDVKAMKSLRQVAWAGTNEDQKAATLEKEFEASMQCIMAAAIAIDAFYAVIQTRFSFPIRMVALRAPGGCPLIG